MKIAKSDWWRRSRLRNFKLLAVEKTSFDHFGVGGRSSCFSQYRAGKKWMWHIDSCNKAQPHRVRHNQLASWWSYHSLLAHYPYDITAQLTTNVMLQPHLSACPSLSWRSNLNFGVINVTTVYPPLPLLVYIVTAICLHHNLLAHHSLRRKELRPQQWCIENFCCADFKHRRNRLCTRTYRECRWCR